MDPSPGLPNGSILSRSGRALVRSVGLQVSPVSMCTLRHGGSRVGSCHHHQLQTPTALCSSPLAAGACSPLGSSCSAQMTSGDRRSWRRRYPAQSCVPFTVDIVSIVWTHFVSLATHLFKGVWVSSSFGVL